MEAVLILGIFVLGWVVGLLCYMFLPTTQQHVQSSMTLTPVSCSNPPSDARDRWKEYRDRAQWGSSEDASAAWTEATNLAMRVGMLAGVPTSKAVVMYVPAFAFARDIGIDVSMAPFTSWGARISYDDPDVPHIIVSDTVPFIVQRMLIAVGIGEILFGDGNECGIPSRWPPWYDETVAYRFAMELLLPESAVRDMVEKYGWDATPQTIAEALHVPCDMAEARLNTARSMERVSSSEHS